MRFNVLLLARGPVAAHRVIRNPMLGESQADDNFPNTKRETVFLSALSISQLGCFQKVVWMCDPLWVIRRGGTNL